MKKTVGIAIISLTLASCAGVDHLSCPAFSNQDNYENPHNYYETEAIHENLTEEEYYELFAQEYAPDSDEVN